MSAHDSGVTLLGLRGHLLKLSRCRWMMVVGGHAESSALCRLALAMILSGTVVGPPQPLCKHTSMLTLLARSRAKCPLNGSMPTTARDAWYVALVLRPTVGCTRPVGQPTVPLQATNLLTTQWEGRLSRPLLTYKLVGPAPCATSLLLLRVSGPAPFPVL